MELWIRSQDKKELIKSNRIYQYASVIYAEAKEEVELGNYKTRERALEVLDEIQRKLTLPNYDTTKNTYSQYDKLIESKTRKESSTYVYEMPEE